MSEIELSVVTGTYNRLSYLQEMIDSVRESIGVGIPYEIVLADGGSKDGTIDWCKEQSDVTLIEQGELLGAIKAFNAGLFAARGRYCVVGNDDITYLDETLIKALAFMHDNPTVGVGCFYQDRDHPGRWDLSRMPAVLNNMQVMYVYGQVCIVPKWLGDEVGWWGDLEDMRTYGGDNNLSSCILEKGYKVTGIPCACISDMQVDDELRHINNALRIHETKTRGGHPDSNAWGRHWTHRDGTCGAIVQTVPFKPNPLVRKTRFMYLPIYELGHDIQRTQKCGLKEALANYGLVYEYDWLRVASERDGDYMIKYMMDIIDDWNPDVLLTQIHTPDPHMFNARIVRTIRNEYPKMLWANWNGDYHPEDLLSPANMLMAKEFDLQCVVTTRVREDYAKHGVSWMYWQIGYEESSAQPDSDTPPYDVVFLANGYSKARIRMGHLLKALEDVNVGIYGSWSGGIPVNGSNLYNFDEGHKLYRASKLSIGDNQWGSKAAGFVSNRVFQAMSAGGAMLLHQAVPELEELLGLKNGVHYVAWSDLDELRDWIYYWLKPENDRKRRAIAAAGKQLMKERHTFDCRVHELMDIML